MKLFLIFAFIITHLNLCLPLHGMDQGTKVRRTNALPNLNNLNSNPLVILRAQATPPELDLELAALEFELVNHFLARYAPAREPLSCAEKKHIAIKIKELVNKKFLNIATLNGGNFLHHAARLGDYKFIKILLANGADKEVFHQKSNEVAIVIARDKQSLFDAGTKNYKDYQKCIDLLAEPEPEASHDYSGL